MTARTRPLLRVALRMTLLVAWIILANAWVLLQFGIELSSVFFIEAAIGLAAFLMKALTKRDNKAVHDALQRAFYALLRTPLLIATYVLLATLTLTFSAVVVKGAGAEKTCVRRGPGSCARALVKDDDKAIFFTRVGHSTAQLGDSEPVSLSHLPWIPTRLSTATSFDFPPAVLVRVGYHAHFALAGGTIEVRDAQTKQVVASAATSADSASLLIGRAVPLPPDVIAAWDGDLAGVKPVPAQNARNRWRNFLRPQGDVKLAPNQQLEAVFRTRAQVVVASHSFPVEHRSALQDVVMKKVP